MEVMSMGLVYKQLFKQLIKDKVFLSLLFLLAMLTSLSFFFVTFSIDGNMAVLSASDVLNENQQLYKNALNSNTLLAYNFFASLTGLSALVFVMFFYRFFRANRRQIGCIKALGFKDGLLQLFFVVFTAALSFLGSLFGLIGGYFLSDILINANSRTYLVTDLRKEIGSFHLLIGLTVSAAVFCITAFLCYRFVKNKEAGSLLAGNNSRCRYSVTLETADKISGIAPVNKRLSLRIALRKPLSVLLLFTAVMSFSVCIILGQSLHLSSEKVFDSQIEGRHYEYDVRFTEYQTAEVSPQAMVYLDCPATFFIGNHELERTLTGLYHTNGLYELKNRNHEVLLTPEAGTVYINPELSEIYGIGIGDTLTAELAGIRRTFLVKDMAVNAKSNGIYMNGAQLAEILGVTAGAYNGVFCTDEMEGDTVTAKSQRMDDLRRNAVSNQISGVINQSMGVLAGAILIFLALYVSFQDNTHDILILHMIGYRVKEIRKMLVNVYLPVLWAAFAVTLAPAILLAKSIQRSLSVSTNDYMPFGINLFLVIAAFILIHFIYFGVQITFGLGIKRLIGKKELTSLVEND